MGESELAKLSKLVSQLSVIVRAIWVLLAGFAFCLIWAVNMQLAVAGLQSSVRELDQHGDELSASFAKTAIKDGEQDARLNQHDNELRYLRVSER